VSLGLAAGRRPPGLRERVRRGGAGFSVSVSAVFSGDGEGDSTGVASGVGSGVGSGAGAAAISVTGGAGSSIRAPTDDTRLVPGVRAGTSVSGGSVSAISGPPITGSNDPPKNSR